MKLSRRIQDGRPEQLEVEVTLSLTTSGGFDMGDMSSRPGRRCGGDVGVGGGGYAATQCHDGTTFRIAWASIGHRRRQLGRSPTQARNGPLIRSTQERRRGSVGSEELLSSDAGENKFNNNFKNLIMTSYVIIIITTITCFLRGCSSCESVWTLLPVFPGRRHTVLQRQLWRLLRRTGRLQDIRGLARFSDEPPQCYNLPFHTDCLFSVLDFVK